MYILFSININNAIYASVPYLNFSLNGRGYKILIFCLHTVTCQNITGKIYISTKNLKLYFYLNLYSIKYEYYKMLKV